MQKLVETTQKKGLYINIYIAPRTTVKDKESLLCITKNKSIKIDTSKLLDEDYFVGISDNENFEYYSISYSIIKRIKILFTLFLYVPYSIARFRFSSLPFEIKTNLIAIFRKI